MNKTGYFVLSARSGGKTLYHAPRASEKWDAEFDRADGTCFCTHLEVVYGLDSADELGYEGVSIEEVHRGTLVPLETFLSERIANLVEDKELKPHQVALLRQQQ